MTSTSSGTTPWLNRARPPWRLGRPRPSPRQLRGLAVAVVCHRRVPVDGSMWRPTEAEAIYRETPRSNGVMNRARNRQGQAAWTDRPRPVSARFGPVSLPDASRSIVDLLPSTCGPLTSSSPRFRKSSLSRKLQHLLFSSLEFYGFMLWSLGHLESCSSCILTCAELHDLLIYCSLNFPGSAPFSA
jgi:hypothetical protein